MICTHIFIKEYALNKVPFLNLFMVLRYVIFTVCFARPLTVAKIEANARDRNASASASLYDKSAPR